MDVCTRDGTCICVRLKLLMVDGEKQLKTVSGEDGSQEAELQMEMDKVNQVDHSQSGSSA